MDSVSKSIPYSYTSANVGIIKPPDKLGRWKLTDAELEDKFHKIDKDVTSHQKHYSFEDKKKTPILVKLLFFLSATALVWQGIKRGFRK